MRDGRPLDLSAKEFGVLEALEPAQPGLLSAEELLEQVWDENADPFTKTVTVTISRLRRKLGARRSSRPSRTWGTRSQPGRTEQRTRQSGALHVGDVAGTGEIAHADALADPDDVDDGEDPEDAGDMDDVDDPMGDQ